MKYELWNNDWKFWEEVNAFSLVWNIPENARDISLPHDAMLERSPRPDSPNGGDTAYRDGGNYVYVKEFVASESLRGKLVAVKFEGIYMNALVYLNGQLVGKRPYGYSPFVVYLNDYLLYGEKNELRVLVKNNGMPNSRWYSGSGIYRDVWFLCSEACCIADEGIAISTEYIEDDYASMKLKASLVNKGFNGHSLSFVCDIFDPSGRLVSTACCPISLLGGRNETIELKFNVDSPALWSAEDPNLYSCRARLEENDKVIDSLDADFGIRTLKLDSRCGLRVNGNSVNLRGACIHHDNGLLGAVACDEAEMRKIRILKQAGFNAIRCAHNPASAPLLRACDKLGMYVMDESFDMWTRPKKDNDYALFIDKWWHEDIEAMVKNDYNHPSVIFYSLGNEIPEVGTAQGSAFGREMVGYIKTLDPTRYAMVSINGVFASGDHVPRIMGDVISAAASRGEDVGNVNDFMTAMDTHMDEIVRHPLVSSRIDAASVGMDLVGYNYMASRYEPDSVSYPDRVIVGSETYPPQIARNWALVEKLPSVIGDFTWTGWDYIGEAGVGVPAYRFGEGGFGAQYPCQLAYCGDIDITGFRRPASYLREMVFGLRNAPYIAVQSPAHYGEKLIKTPWVLSDSHSSWTYPGFENKSVVVEVYSPGDEVELIINGVSLGRKPAGKAAGFIASFETVYTPGTIEAISYENGSEIGRHRLHSASSAASVSLEPESSEGRIRYVNICLRDENGLIYDADDCEISLSLVGGTLLGLGSGDPKPLHNYTENKCRLYRGRALAILRCDSSVTLSVSTETGLSASLTL